MLNEFSTIREYENLIKLDRFNRFEPELNTNKGSMELQLDGYVTIPWTLDARGDLAHLVVNAQLKQESYEQWAKIQSIFVKCANQLG